MFHNIICLYGDQIGHKAQCRSFAGRQPQQSVHYIRCPSQPSSAPLPSPKSGNGFNIYFAERLKIRNFGISFAITAFA